MFFGCITSARFTMTAEVMSQGKYTPSDGLTDGHWEVNQDPDTGAIERIWVPNKTDHDQDLILDDTFPCLAQGMMAKSTVAISTGFSFGTDGMLLDSEFLTLNYPKTVTLSKNDKITNIRSSEGVLLWKEEESDGRPTIFIIKGMTPIMDPFGQHSENKAILARAEVQDGG